MKRYTKKNIQSTKIKKNDMRPKRNIRNKIMQPTSTKIYISKVYLFDLRPENMNLSSC